MAIDRQASTPLYIQLKDMIAAEIREGALQPGARLRSEAELERTHRVSRITVRQALGALVQDGDLYRVPGKGTYVAVPKVAPLAAFTSFSENMAAQGLTPSYRVLSVAWVAPPPPRATSSPSAGGSRRCGSSGFSWPTGSRCASRTATTRNGRSGLPGTC